MTKREYVYYVKKEKLQQKKAVSNGGFGGFDVFTILMGTFIAAVMFLFVVPTVLSANHDITNRANAPIVVNDVPIVVYVILKPYQNYSLDNNTIAIDASGNVNGCFYVEGRTDGRSLINSCNATVAVYIRVMSG